MLKVKLISKCEYIKSRFINVNFYYGRVSFFIQSEDLALEPLHIRTLEIVLLVLLLKKRHVFVNFASFV